MFAKRDLSLSLAAVLLIICMALPSIMKLAHAIHGHNHQKCTENIALHLHEAGFDCEFQKFKLTQQFYAPLQEFRIFQNTSINERNYNYYFFLSSYQKLHFSLRGPPSVS